MERLEFEGSRSRPGNSLRRGNACGRVLCRLASGIRTGSTGRSCWVSGGEGLVGGGVRPQRMGRVALEAREPWLANLRRSRRL